MTKIIITTPEELRKLIEEVIFDSLSKQTKNNKETVSIANTTISLEEAVTFLTETGFPTSKSKIYKLTSKNQIPYQKYGSKLYFSKKELLQWVDSKLIRMTDNSESILEIIKSANRKNK